MDLMTVLESLVTDLEAGLDRASSLDELEELRESLNEAWDAWTETCLVWQEIRDEWV